MSSTSTAQRPAIHSSKKDRSALGGHAHCGTKRPSLLISRSLDTHSMQLDLCDSSSDEGDALQTPVSDSAALVQIAFIGNSPVLQVERDRATHDATKSSSSTPEKHLYLAGHQNNLQSPPLRRAPLADLHQHSPLTASSSQTRFSTSYSNSTLGSISTSTSTSEEYSGDSSFASLSSTEAILTSSLNSSALLETSSSLEGFPSSPDLAPSSLDTSLSSVPPSTLPGPLRPMNPFSSRYAPPPSSPLAQSFSASQLSGNHASVHDDTQSPLNTTEAIAPSSPQPRKRLLDRMSPLINSRPGQKPKLSRSVASEFLPSTLGRSYSSRFPAEHRLRADFVREYALDGELGKGGYGFVMAARHRRDGYEVAVKFITKARIPAVSWSIDDCGRPVPKEARILSQLDHPGIVKFYDLFEDDVYFYMIQELHGSPWFRKKSNNFINGPQSSQGNSAPVDENRLPTSGHSQPPLSPLANAALPQHSTQNVNVLAPSKVANGHLARPSPVRRASHDLFECIESTKNKRFSEEDAKYIFAQVVDVVIYLDQHGIAHSDIKDENVVIDSDLKIKLIDFGSGLMHNPAEPSPFHTRFYGTSAFAAPEIITNKPWQSQPAEVWSLGMLLSYLMRGASPFPTDADKLLGRVVLDEKSRKRVSDGCLALMQRCLRADPRERATIWDVRDDPWLREGFERLWAIRREEEEDRELDLAMEEEMAIVGVRSGSPELR